MKNIDALKNKCIEALEDLKDAHKKLKTEETSTEINMLSELNDQVLDMVKFMNSLDNLENENVYNKLLDTLNLIKKIKYQLIQRYMKKRYNQNENKNMKKSELRSIIKEEIANVINETFDKEKYFNDIKALMKDLRSKFKDDKQWFSSPTGIRIYSEPRTGTGYRTKLLGADNQKMVTYINTKYKGKFVASFLPRKYPDIGGISIVPANPKDYEKK